MRNAFLHALTTCAVLGTAVLAASCGGPASPPPRLPPESAVESPPPAPPPLARDDDGDTLADAADGCPAVPEDLDFFEDGDGCVDPDNDEDRIPDGDDRCPNEPETYNGRDDEDGCPDPTQVVTVNDPPPHGSERVRFAKGEADVRASEHDLLRAVVQVLEQNPQVESVLVEGHAASDEGSARSRTRLSLRRAEAVLDFLVEAGVAADRLRSAGYGDLCPFDPGETREARDANRVVTFTILRTGGRCTRLERGCPAARDAGLVPVDDCMDAPAE